MGSCTRVEITRSGHPPWRASHQASGVPRRRVSRTRVMLVVRRLSFSAAMASGCRSPSTKSVPLVESTRVTSGRTRSRSIAPAAMAGRMPSARDSARERPHVRLTHSPERAVP